MKRRTARILRRAADHLDPKPARWYASAWQQSHVTTSSSAQFYTVGPMVTGIGDARVRKAWRRRVLADYLSSMDLKKLRP